MKKLELTIGSILTVAAIAGILFTVLATGPNGPHGGITPLILLPYPILIVGLGGALLLRNWFLNTEE